MSEDSEKGPKMKIHNVKAEEDVENEAVETETTLFD